MEWIDVSDEMPPAEKPVLIVVQFSGTKITRKILRAMWCPKNTVEPMCEDEAVDYDADKDCYYLAEGWYEWNQYDEVNWAVCDPVTHWMLLPELPGGANA